MIPRDSRDPFTDPFVLLDRKVLSLDAEIVALKAENERLRKALENVTPYAKEAHYRSHYGRHGYVCEERCPPCKAEKLLEKSDRGTTPGGKE